MKNYLTKQNSSQGSYQLLNNISRTFPEPSNQISKAMKPISIVKPPNSRKTLFSTMYSIIASRIVFCIINSNINKHMNIYRA